MNPICCDKHTIWVENVPGKGYHYCKECKTEVVIAIETPSEHFVDSPGQYDEDYWFML